MCEVLQRSEELYHDISHLRGKACPPANGSASRGGIYVGGALKTARTELFVMLDRIMEAFVAKMACEVDYMYLPNGNM